MIFCAIIALLAASNTFAQSTRPSPVHYRHEVHTNPPLHLHIATIDLTDPSVHVIVCRGGPDPDGDGPWETTLMPVREIAQREGMELAVNGNFFSGKDSILVAGKRMPYKLGNWASVVGLAMSEGKLWSNSPSEASLVVDSHGKITIDHFDHAPADAQEIVSGMELLVKNRKPLAHGDERAPRTAAGIDAAGKTLVLLVVDGRRDDYSVGLTLPQEADEMIKLGCSDALNLDGGGSSTMVMRDDADKLKLMNRPSDGHDLIIPMSLERAVADVVGIKISTTKDTKGHEGNTKETTDAHR